MERLNNLSTETRRTPDRGDHDDALVLPPGQLVGPVAVTRADGTRYVVGAYDDQQLRVIRAGGVPRQPQVSSRMRMSIYMRDTGICQRCGRDCSKTPWEVDHIVPGKAQGRTEWNNLQLLCRTCNRQKGDSIPEARE